MVIDAAAVRDDPDPLALLTDFVPAGTPLTLASRITGPIESAYGDGPPEEIEDAAVRAAHLSRSDGPVNIVVVADGDLLSDDTWVTPQTVMGQRVFVTTASNGAFVTNTLDNLSGSTALLGLRGKGLRIRPFEVLEAMQRQAEDRYRAKEKELQAKIDDMRERIRSLQEEEQSGGVILTAEQQVAIERFREEMLDLREELRAVQFALREDVDRLRFWIQVLNIWAIPLLIGLLAIALALLRRRKAAHNREDIERPISEAVS